MSSNYSVKKRELEVSIGINPFVSDFVLRVRKLHHAGAFISDVDGDMLPLYVDLDGSPKVNVYTTSELREAVSGLSGFGKSLFLWLMYEIDYGCDYVRINKERYMLENGYKSLWSYRKGRNELVECAIISPSVVSGIYWVNPRYFFAGNRPKKYPNNVSKK